MRRLAVGVLVACLLATGAASVQPASARTPPPGPPYPDAINGVRVYDYAGVLAADTIAAVEATIAGIEERSGAELVVYTQVKPESDTPEEARRDAAALIDQWGVGQAGIDDGLAILFDLEPNRCHGQVQLYAGSGYRVRYLDNEARQAIFEQEMLPALRGCDFDAALLAAMERIDVVHASLPPWFGGRVEMPEHGFAVTLPDDWVAFDTAADIDTQLHGLETGGIELHEDDRASLAEVLTDRRRALVAVVVDSPEVQCAVAPMALEPEVGWSEEWADNFLGSMAFTNIIDQTIETVDAPVGPGRSLTGTGTEPHNGGQPVRITVYHVERTGDLYVLLCYGDTRHADDWLSIAETIEFLPVEE